jgi:hypothetical protein
MGSGDDTPLACEGKRLHHGRWIPGMPATCDVRTGDDVKDRLVIAHAPRSKRLPQIRIEIDFRHDFRQPFAPVLSASSHPGTSKPRWSTPSPYASRKRRCWLRVASLCGGLGPPFARGFGAKLTIHPAQIEPVKRGFLPSKERLYRFRFEELCSKIGGEMVEHVVFSQEPG